MPDGELEGARSGRDIRNTACMEIVLLRMVSRGYLDRDVAVFVALELCGGVLRRSYVEAVSIEATARWCQDGESIIELDGTV